ncbi:hypothetical protein [Paenibacillus periandrae]|uniref:hypothetical protein n=1 Tax=Paenibacillus periandrae TaxID=1761741 RepID=UPI001F08F000|nr:hypothetical protein [Paenibacillus periandrae]
MKTQAANGTASSLSHKASLFWSRLIKGRYLYMMVTPGLLYFAIFKYLPMWGVMISFKDYLPYRGCWNSPWVGFKHFDRFFHDPVFWLLLKNTFVLAIYNIVFFFPIPIIIALMLNELRVECKNGPEEEAAGMNPVEQTLLMRYHLKGLIKKYEC